VITRIARLAGQHPPRPKAQGYIRTPRDMQAYVPDHAAALLAAGS